jgi:transposase
MTEEIPWAAPFSRVSYRFEYLMLRYCQIMTQKAAAELLGIATSSLSDLLHRAITRIRAGHRIRGLTKLGIDEISHRKGHKYATLVIDRFHVIKALGSAVDEVRKEQWRIAGKDERKALKGLRWLLFRHSSTRSRRDTRTLRTLETANRRIYRAWRLKDEFEQLWEYKAPWAAQRFLKRWTTSALRSRLEPLRKFVRTVRTHEDGIIAFVRIRLTNAVAEGLNRIARMVHNRASGFRSLDAFTDMSFLTIGDIDIPAQVPEQFHTI